MDQADCYDAIVIGAGLSGCRTANLLRKSGFERVLVLEANDRIGGRLHTVLLDPPTAGGKRSVVDLGGMWQGARHHRLVELAGELGIELYEQYEAGRHAVHSQNGVHWYKGTIPLVPSATGVLSLLEAQISLLWAVDIMAELVPINYFEQPWQFPEAAHWDSMTVRSWANGKLWLADTILMLETAVAMVFGVQASELSMLFFLFAVKTSGGLSQLIDNRGGSQHARLKTGAMSLCTALLKQTDGVELRLNSPVTSIETVAASATNATAHVIVKTASVNPSTSAATTVARYVARYCVLSAAPSISFEKIAFTPPLPYRRQQAMSRCFMGCYTKAIVRYVRPFWRERGLSGMCVNMQPSSQLPVSAIFDYCSPAAGADDETQTIALACFIVGEIGVAFNALSAEAKERAVRQSLVHFFGAEADDDRLLVDVTIKEWANEPFTRGCPINIFPAGGYLQIGHLLREPIDDCLFFAGTETAMSAPGYMEGALESAGRVTQEVVDSKNQASHPEPKSRPAPPSVYQPTLPARFRVYKLFDFRLWSFLFFVLVFAVCSSFL